MKPTCKKVLRTCGAVVVVALYVTSFFQLVSDEKVGPGGSMTGLEAFAWTFAFIPLSGTPVWFANPLLWASVVCLVRRCPKEAAKLSAVAVLLAVVVLTRTDEMTLQIGYYLWLGSMVLTLALAVVDLSTRPPPRTYSRSVGNDQTTAGHPMEGWGG